METKLAKIRRQSGFDSYSNNIARRVRPAAVAVCVVSAWVLVVFAATANADIVTLNNNDGNGNTTSYNGPTNWSNAAPPDGTHDYLAISRSIRIPAVAGAVGNTNQYGVTINPANPALGDWGFLGNSLTLSDGANLIYKDTLNGDTMSFAGAGLTLDAGLLYQAQGGVTQIFATGIQLTANGGLIWCANNGNANTTVRGNISGIGPLAIGSTFAGANTAQNNTLSGTNTYTGGTYLMGGTVTLGSAGALPSTTTLTFGSASNNITNNIGADGNGRLDLAGFNATVGGLAVSNYTATTGVATAAAAQPVQTGTYHFAAGLPAGIALGQRVTQGANTSYIIAIDRSTNDVILAAQIGAGTFNFSALNPTAANQVITNLSTTTDSTLTFAGGSNASIFPGTITNPTAATSHKTGLTVAAGSLTLTGANTYTGNTTTSGGVLNLDFSATGTPASNIINNNYTALPAGNLPSALVLGGGSLNLTGKASTTNSQLFNGTTVSGSSTVKLNANATANPLALNLGAVTRTVGTFDVVNPAGTLSATNGVLTTSGTASSLLTDSTGAAYVTVGGTEWGAKDASNAFIVPLSTVGSYTGSTATALSGNADVVGNVNLPGNTTVSTLRFNSGSQTISGGTLSTGGILVTGNSGASAINGGTLKGTAGGNLTIIQNNTTSNLAVGSAISDNGSATALDKSGPGAAILSGTNTYTGTTNVVGGTLQFAKQVALYNNNPSAWTTPGNINVTNGATLAVNVGGTGEFATADVGTLAGLSGFQSGSALGIDTTNASGNVQLAVPIANPNGGANALGVTKLGAGTLVVAAADTYTGATTVAGGTLRLGGSGAGSISTSSPIVIANVAGATFDLNNNSTTLKSLSGGGSTGGAVTMGSGNLTFSSGPNSTFAGALTGTGGVIVTGGGSQALTGTPSYTGATTINTGTLSVSSSSSSTVGSANKDVTIAPGLHDVGTLIVGAGVTLNAGNILVGSVDTAATVGGAGTLNQTGGSINASTLFLGGSGTALNPATGSLRLSGGSLTVPAVTTGGGSAAVINFNGGTLRAATGSNPGSFVDTNITTVVQTGGATIDTNGNSFAMSNNFVHDPASTTVDGGFNKAGAGTLTLNGVNTFTGVTAVSGGTLIVQSANPASSGYAVNGAGATLDLSPLGTLSLSTGKTLQGIGTVMTSGISHTAGIITGGVSGTPNSMGVLTLTSGSLDLGGGTVRFDLSNSAAGTNDKIEANGGLTASAASILDIEFATLPTSSQSYRLFDYTGGSVSGSAANFVLAGNGGRGLALNFATPGQVNLTFTAGLPSANLVWNKTGSAPQLWDIQTTKSWNNTTSSNASDVFFNGDFVKFDDTAGVQTSVSIPNGISVAPGSVTVNSNTNNFSISSPGTGKITGSTSIVKSGSSTLTLATSNDYQGGTTINDNGKIIALDVGSTGVASATGAGPVTVGANATLQIGNGTTAGAGTVIGPVHNSGSLIINRPDSFNFATAVDGSGTLTVQGGGTTTVTGASTYSGNTNITNGTLQAGGANAFSPASTVVLSNTANSTLDLGGQAQNVGGLSGGGATGGTVNANAAITFTGSGTNTFTGAFNGGGSAINMNSAGLVQNLNGTINFTGAITVSNGTLGFSPSADTTLGGGAINLGTAAGNVGTLTIGPHATLLTSALTVGANNGSNGNGTLVQTGGTINATGTVNLGNNGGIGTLNLSGGTMNMGPVNMAINGNGNNSGCSATIIVGAGEQANVINGNIIMGQFYNPPGTITLNGGNLTMAADTTGTPNPTGIVRFQNNNAQNMGIYTVNLNGGALTAAGAEISITADSSGTGNFNLNVRPTFNFNGGTLRAGNDNTNFFNPSGAGAVAAATIAAGGNPFATNILEKGGTFDTNGHNVGVSTVLAHGGSAAVDGGLTVNDTSGTGLGVLNLSALNTYTGPTKIAGGTLQLGIANAIPSVSTVNMAGGIFSLNNFGEQAGMLKTTAASTIDMLAGNGGEILQFADSSGNHWAVGNTTSGATLHIANWSGNIAGGGIDQIVFPTLTSLTPNQLNQIVFDGSGLTHAKLVATGAGAELVPTNTAPTGLVLVGDVNLDGHVNSADVVALVGALGDLNAYKAAHGLTDAQFSNAADLNGNDLVDNGDLQSLLTLLKSGGGSGSVAAVPEPASFTLLALGGVLCLAWQRRRCSPSQH